MHVESLQVNSVCFTGMACDIKEVGATLVSASCMFLVADQ